MNNKSQHKPKKKTNPKAKVYKEKVFYKTKEKKSFNTKKSNVNNVNGEQVEGIHAVKSLLKNSSRKTKKIFVDIGKKNISDNSKKSSIEIILDLAKANNIPIEYLSAQEFSSLSNSSTPQSIIAIAEPIQFKSIKELLEISRLVIACDGITDPQNLGTIIRIASTVDAGVVFPKQRNAQLTPTVIKAAAGAIETVPLLQCGGIANWIIEAKKENVIVVGCDHPSQFSIFELSNKEIPKNSSVVLVMGAEGKGLSRLSNERCDIIANIPMSQNALDAGVDSHNVAVACGIASYQLARLI